MFPMNEVTKYSSFAAAIDQAKEMLRNDEFGNDDRSQKKEYYALNLKRIARLEQFFEPDTELLNQIQALTHPQIWWVFTELWCGDCAQNLPMIDKMAKANPEMIDLRIILRDDYPGIMDHYLTNGGRSIPKLIATDPEGHELFQWGPRPRPAQNLLQEWKTNPAGRTDEDFHRELHTWYAQDKGITLQAEFRALLR
jgi:hypothetical protein